MKSMTSWLFYSLLAITLQPHLLAKDSLRTVTQHFSVQHIAPKRIDAAASKMLYGYIRANDATTYDVAPRFGGYVKQLYANTLYQRIKKGDALLTLYSPEVYKAKEEYLASYAYTKNSPNAQMLQSARQNLELLGVSADEINTLRTSRRDSTSTTIYAPASGYLFSKHIRNGSAFSSGETLLEIVNLDNVYAELRIFEEDLALIQAATHFTLSTKSSKKRFKATKVRIFPTLSDAALTLQLRVKNPEHTLLPGMYVNVKAMANTKSYLTLPKHAVIKKQGRYYVFLVTAFDGEYEPKEVQVTVLDAHTYSITKGLRDDDEVVENALFMQDSDAQINGLF